jgi:hypothetical protein
MEVGASVKSLGSPSVDPLSLASHPILVASKRKWLGGFCWLQMAEKRETWGLPLGAKNILFLSHKSSIGTSITPGYCIMRKVMP